MKIQIKTQAKIKTTQPTMDLGIEASDVEAFFASHDEIILTFTQEQALEILNYIKQFAHTGKLPN